MNATVKMTVITGKRESWVILTFYLLINKKRNYLRSLLILTHKINECARAKVSHRMSNRKMVRLCTAYEYLMRRLIHSNLIATVI